MPDSREADEHRRTMAQLAHDVKARTPVTREELYLILMHFDAPYANQWLKQWGMTE